MNTSTNTTIRTDYQDAESAPIITEITTTYVTEDLGTGGVLGTSTKPAIIESIVVE